jgi:holo-[acyl-carrier protein] synthase
MASPPGASRFRGDVGPSVVRGGMAALLPVRMPGVRPWGGRKRTSGTPDPALRPGPQIGVDLIAVSRVRRVFEGKPVLLATVFTEEELRYSTRQRRPFMHLAARFAAKEAALKALGTGLTGRMAWRDVETVHGPWAEPRLILRGEVARLARAKGLHRCAVSLSHAGGFAMAAVIFTA